MRGIAPNQSSAIVDGTQGQITEYPFRTDIPLSPPAPNYSGPEFFGGFRATFRDRATPIAFSTNSFSGSNTSIRVQPPSPVTARQQGVFFFDKTAFPGVSSQDTVTFDSDSFLTITGIDLIGGALAGSRWRHLFLSHRHP
ncbi:MAG: hypothetical protein LR015_00070 [Verrucomicrobia bacterium]|nr:hypothetical protein [Verrucomicrobiota bacterium]